MTISRCYLAGQRHRGHARASGPDRCGSEWTEHAAAPMFAGMADNVELLVAGGGLNGMLLGIACADAGLKVAVVDRQDPATMLGETFDGRTTAIAYGSKLVLDGVGVWPGIADEAEPIREIRVADDDSPLFLHYDHRELKSSEPLG